ncbi:MAG: hypothetical protein CFH01_01470 [Alphaproteobacteria bacterium MarineAlpha2_Bin1]|nr:MAG: hypothetical protein CFH01_01470 [Alphaproteobacteria bacterium MarineAlpha2_Bin1]
MFYLNNTHKFKIFFSLFLVVSLVSNCGFQPLYFVKDGVNLSSIESQIEVKNIDGRTGQILRNSLLEKFGSESSNTKTLSLKITLTKSVVPLAFRRDKTVTRFNVIIDADYILKNLSNGKILTDGTSSSIASYSVVFSEFANLSAARDAEERAVIDISKNISRIVGFYLINLEDNK